MLRPLCLGSMKKSISSVLHLLVSSIVRAAPNGKLVFMFLSDMKISFPWALEEGGGLGVAVLRPTGVLTVSANESGVA